MFLIENLDILILNEENLVKRNNVVIINPKNQTITIKSKKKIHLTMVHALHYNI